MAGLQLGRHELTIWPTGGVRVAQSTRSLQPRPAKLLMACAFMGAFAGGLALAALSAAERAAPLLAGACRDAVAAQGARRQQTDPMPEPPLDHRRRVAFVHKARAGSLTIRGMQAALVAKEQVEAAGGSYNLIYSVHPADLTALTEPKNEKWRVELEMLWHGLGGAAVFAVGADGVREALGAALLSEQRRVFGEQEWAWATNDAVDVAWFLARGEAALPPWAQHIWLVELDVGWTGDIVDALTSTLRGDAAGASNTSSSAGSSMGGGSCTPLGEGAGGCAGAADSGAAEPDWVSFNTQKADDGWRWFAVRNDAARGDVWRSYRHACRASRRLLHALAAEMRAGRVQSDEAGAASVCAANYEWCVADTSWQPGHPVIGSHPETGEALYRWESVISSEVWGRIVAADAARAAAMGCSGGAVPPPRAGCSRLYHKLKW